MHSGGPRAPRDLCGRARPKPSPAPGARPPAGPKDVPDTPPPPRRSRVGLHTRSGCHSPIVQQLGLRARRERRAPSRPQRGAGARRRSERKSLPRVGLPDKQLQYRREGDPGPGTRAGRRQWAGQAGDGVFLWGNGEPRGRGGEGEEPSWAGGGQGGASRGRFQGRRGRTTTEERRGRGRGSPWSLRLRDTPSGSTYPRLAEPTGQQDKALGVWLRGPQPRPVSPFQSLPEGPWGPHLGAPLVWSLAFPEGPQRAPVPWLGSGEAPVCQPSGGCCEGDPSPCSPGKAAEASTQNHGHQPGLCPRSWAPSGGQRARPERTQGRACQRVGLDSGPGPPLAQGGKSPWGGGTGVSLRRCSPVSPTSSQRPEPHFPEKPRPRGHVPPAPRPATGGGDSVQVVPTVPDSQPQPATLPGGRHTLGLTPRGSAGPRRGEGPSPPQASLPGALPWGQPAPREGDKGG